MGKKVRKTIIECIIIIVVGTVLFLYTHRNDEKDMDDVNGTYVEKTENTAKKSEEEYSAAHRHSDDYEDALEDLEAGKVTEEELEKKKADAIQLKINGMNGSVESLIPDKTAFEYALKQRHLRTYATNSQVVTCTNEIEYEGEKIRFYFIDEMGERFFILYDGETNAYSYTLNWEE